MPLRAAWMIVGFLAVMEMAFIATFVFLSLFGDELGIARGMAFLLGGVFALTMGPAILLLRAGWPIPAATLSVISAAIYVIWWRNA